MLARYAKRSLLLLLPLLMATEQWERPRAPVIAPFPGTTGISAASCGQCHTEIYAEWSASTHAHAWVDAQYQAELVKDPEVAWLCLNCHTPVANQLPVLTEPTGNVRAPVRTRNDQYDPKLQQEGITCLTCHWRPEGIAAPHADTQAPHPVVYAPELRTNAACTVCHQAAARLEDALVCTFNTGAEWEAAAPGRTCPECHMPAVERPVVTGGPVRAGGRHTFPGSLIPKDDASPEERALFADWEAGVDATATVPTDARPGQAVTLTYSLSNVRAGHMVPTGDPERYLLLTATVVDTRGDVLVTEQQRIGQRWKWWPVAEKLSDNRLAPGEARSWPIAFTMPDATATLVLRLEHYRISPENAEYHNLGDYPISREVSSERFEIHPSP